MTQTRRTILAGGAATALASAAGRVAEAAATDKPDGAGAGATGLDYPSAGDLVAALQARKVSAMEFVDHAIARIEALDGRINAVVVRDFDRARAAAAAADRALAAGEHRPLLGVPMTVKEAFDVAGLATTWGVAGAERTTAGEDAVAVRRLKAAGAIVIGKTNVPLMLSDWQSYNAIYGVTNNPWDLARTPGGSSGGSAAALAAGFVPLEFGSDIGGSLRVPADFCGVFAHKPSHDLVPMRGSAPPGAPVRSVSRVIDLAVVGPMARSAADLALALDVTAGPDDAEAVAYRLALPPPRHAALEDFRVLALDTHPLLPTSEAVRAALAGTTDALRKAGCTVEAGGAHVPDLAVAGRLYSQLLTAVTSPDLPAETYQRLQAAAAALPAAADTLAAARLRGTVMTHADWIRTDRARAGVADRWHKLFADWDVVLCPVMPTVAFAHDHGEMRARHIVVDGQQVPYADQSMWPSVATLTGLPATAMPIGRDPQGLPIGMQIIGPYLEDRTTIAFAQLVEREFGGFVAPPTYKS